MKLLFAVIACISATTCHGQAEGTTVQTQQGTVAGTLVSPGVRQFLGIPYAVASRWQAPQPPPSRSTTFEASNFGDTCVQSLDAATKKVFTLVGLGDQNIDELEDCLSVNIWAPAAGRKQGTAVMLWVYGGGFAYGSSNTRYYYGQNLVRDNDDVIVVSFNYRLNIFGQPNAPQLMNGSQSQNFGFLDLKAAVNWVHDNIAAFGGDPERIILFGQSAGGSSIDAYTYANPGDTIVKGVIEESGSLAGNAFTPQTNTSSANSWKKVATAVGCGSSATATQFSCMQAVSFRTLENEVAILVVLNQRQMVRITYFSDITARSAAGNFLHVPLLVGTTAQEGDIFVVAAEEAGLGFMIPVLTQGASDVMTQLSFNCPAGTTAGDRAKAGIPTWRYRYGGVFPDLTGSRSDLRAYHTSEIPIMFGTYNFSNFQVAPTSTEVALSKYVQRAWVAFARDPARGLINYGWPTYDPSTASLAQLGNSANDSGVLFKQGTAFDTGCDFAESSIAAISKFFGNFS